MARLREAHRRTSNDATIQQDGVVVVLADVDAQ